MMSSIPRTLQAWPPGWATQLIATPKTVDLISQTDPRVFQSLLPGQFTAKINVPERYPDDTFTLQGHELHIIEQGRTDTVDSTSLHVLSIDLVVVGDVLFNQFRNRWTGLTIDCIDPVRLAAFSGALLDRETEPGLHGWVNLTPQHDEQPRIHFQPVPEPKAGKVRIHLDVAVDDVDAAARRVVELGSRDTGQRHECPKGVVVVLTDPEGNEFCVVQRY